MRYSYNKTHRLQTELLALGDTLAEKGYDLEQRAHARTSFPAAAKDFQDIGARIAAFSESPTREKAVELANELDNLFTQYRTLFPQGRPQLPKKSHRESYSSTAHLLIDYAIRVNHVPVSREGRHGYSPRASRSAQDDESEDFDEDFDLDDDDWNDDVDEDDLRLE